MASSAKPSVHDAQLVPISSLTPHPQNYREHPDDQLAHLVQSVREHGFYRNVVAARDGTILAGHGVVEAALEAGLDHVPVVALDLDPSEPKALKLLVADNEAPRFAVNDDRRLAELLREIRDDDLDGLLGTGYDDAALQALVFVTRAEGELPRESDAAAWVGLPEFDQSESKLRLVVHFRSEDDRDEVLDRLDVERPSSRYRDVVAIWWPPREREDLTSLRFEPHAANGDNPIDPGADGDDDEDEPLITIDPGSNGE